MANMNGEVRERLNALIADFGDDAAADFQRFDDDNPDINPLRIIDVMRQHGCDFDDITFALLELDEADYSAPADDDDGGAYEMDVNNNNDPEDDNLPVDNINNEDEGEEMDDVPNPVPNPDNNNGNNVNINEGAAAAEADDEDDPIVIQLDLPPQVQAPHEEEEAIEETNNNNNFPGNIMDYFNHMNGINESESEEEEVGDEEWGIDRFQQEQYRINLYLPKNQEIGRPKRKKISKSIGRSAMQTPEVDRQNAITLMERVNPWFENLDPKNYSGDLKQALNQFLISLNEEDSARYGFCLVPPLERTEIKLWSIQRRWYVATRVGEKMHLDTLAADAQAVLVRHQNRPASVREAVGNAMGNIVSVLTSNPAALWNPTRYVGVASLIWARLMDPNVIRDDILEWGYNTILSPILGGDESPIDLVSETGIDINFNRDRDALVFNSATGNSGIYITNSPRYTVPYQSRKSMMIHLMFKWMRDQETREIWNQSIMSNMIKSILDYGEVGRLFVLSVATEGAAQEHNFRYVCQELVRHDNDAQCQIYAASKRGSGSQRNQHGAIAHVYNKY